MALRVKRNALSLQDKMRILKYFDKKSEGYKKSQIAAELGIPISTLSTIIKYRKDIEEKAKNVCGSVLRRKKNKSGKFLDLEKILVDWISSAQSQNITVTGPMIKERGLEIANDLDIGDFTASSGWLDRFKKRHSIALRHTNEIDLEDDDNSDVSHDALQELIKDYQGSDVFNADEFGLLFKLMPNENLHLEDKKCSDGKMSDERLTILACVNSDGSEKLPLLVIGSTELTSKDTPSQYQVNSQAWMTRELFINWLKVLDDYFEIQGRLIVLFVDDSPVHPKDIILNNINLILLPPDAEYDMPMNQGVIKTIKDNYRTKIIDRYQKEVDASTTQSPVDITDALQYISDSWDAIRPETVQSCFKKSGFGDYYDVDGEEDEDKADILLKYKDYLYVDYEISTCNSVQKSDDACDFDSIQEQENASTYNKELLKLEEQLHTAINVPNCNSSQSSATALTAIANLKQFLSSIHSREGLEKLSFIENVVLESVQNTKTYSHL